MPQQRTPRPFLCALLTAFALPLVAAQATSAQDPETGALRLSSGTAGAGVYHRLGRAIANITAQHELIVVENFESSGSVTNVHRLLRNQCDIALVQADILHAAAAGRSPFPVPMPSLRALASLYSEVVHVVARKDGPINTLADLTGKRVALGAQGSGGTSLALTVIQAHNVARESFEASFTSLPETLADFKAGRVDAFVLVTAAGSPTVQGALNAGGRLVDVSRLHASTLADRAPYLRAATLPIGTYAGQNAAASVILVEAMLAARADLRPETAYEFLDELFDTHQPDPNTPSHFDQLRAVVPTLKKPQEVHVSELFAVPIHPGAMSYYEERDVFPRPIEVHTGIYTNDLFNLDISQGSFDADFYIWFRYRNRLHADPSHFRFEVMNGEIRHLDPPVIEKYGGFTYLSYRVVAQLRSTFPLHRYPFDAQSLPIIIEHPNLEVDRLVFVTDAMSGDRKRNPLINLIEPGTRVGEWHVESIEPSTEKHTYESDMGDPTLAAGEKPVYSRYRYEVRIRRDLVPYLVKFCVPLTIIVLLSFLVFFIPPEEFQIQVIIVVAALLSCVAFHTTQADQLPQVGYLVTADGFFIIAYVTILLTLLQFIFEHTLFRSGRIVLARRLDKIALLVLPVLFFTATTLLVLNSMP